MFDQSQWSVTGVCCLDSGTELKFSVTVTLNQDHSYFAIEIVALSNALSPVWHQAIIEMIILIWTLDLSE